MRGARVHDARLTGCTSHRFRAVGTAQPKPNLPERTEEGRAEQDGRVESPQSSVVHVGVSKLSERRSCCPRAFALVQLQEAVTDPGVSASGGDAIDHGGVGQVAHGVLNVYADASALDIKARSPVEIFNLNTVRMPDDVPPRSTTTKAASTVVKERISKDADFLMQKRNNRLQ